MCWFDIKPLLDKKLLSLSDKEKTDIMKAGMSLGNEVAFHRIKIPTKVAKLLFTVTNERRNPHTTCEDHAEYINEPLNSLLKDIPKVKGDV